jgi:hypothetical protein
MENKLKSEIKVENFTEVTGNKLLNFMKRVVKGEEKIFSIVATSTFLIISVILFLASGAKDIKSHDDMMLRKGAGELLSDGVICKSNILYYKVNSSIALAIDSETDAPFHCKAVDNKIFLK